MIALRFLLVQNSLNTSSQLASLGKISFDIRPIFVVHFLTPNLKITYQSPFFGLVTK